ncbi:unnamed protein product [Hermetia illucens]|uniref:Kazal-like domain-containing protein n=1 Tax=Hermetia illucens TaxID=343691 RepID=A0A7R8YRB3_HERIL|nr:uncharacterized protein LOC119649367 [Hermetia illucens]CAD7081330.1 unnamed protein product [Hermetia illucens]
MISKIFVLLFAIVLAVIGQTTKPICNIRCGTQYVPVCVKQDDGIVREFNNACLLALYNCLNRQSLRPNATCVKDIVREAVQDALRKSQRLPSDSSFQGRAIRDFVDALRRLIRSL